MSRRQPPSTKQESHRVYLQQFSKDVGSKEVTLKTKSTAIRLTSIATANEVCSLLRQKFGYPTPRPQSSSSNSSSFSLQPNTNGRINQNKKKGVVPSTTPLVHRIHARLNQVRQQQVGTSNQSVLIGTAQGSKGVGGPQHNLSDIKRKQRRKQRRKRLLEIQSTDEDALVMVATCSLPKNYVHFEHENEDYFCTGAGHSTQPLSLDMLNTVSNQSADNDGNPASTVNERSTSQGNFFI